ncbi:MAG: hypothetical protein V4663_13060 [Bacteroidota bacterium]
MGKILLLGLLLASSLLGFAQKTDSLKSSIQRNAETLGHGGNNELKLNLLNVINGMPELSYERIIADNMGLGASVFVALDNSVAYKFSFASYYRLYFGKKKASGIFIEGNTGILTLEDEYYADVAHIYKVTSTNFTLGVAVGVKYLTRNGFFGEAYAGGGKLLAYRIGYSIQDFPRIGISLGKRF